MLIKKIHHVAYRCVNAKQTVQWYAKYLQMGFVLAIAEEKVPSTGQGYPYMHVFLDAGGGNILAFFELAQQPAAKKDQNTPDWVQHLALEVGSLADLYAVKALLRNDGIDVIGPVDHTIFQSIYFFDPNGCRIELACNTFDAVKSAASDEVKWDMLEEWERTKHPPRQAAWLHQPRLKSGGNQRNWRH